MAPDIPNMSTITAKAKPKEENLVQIQRRNRQTRIFSFVYEYEWRWQDKQFPFCSVDSSRLNQFSRAMTASTTSWVVLVPPRSLVLYWPSAITRLTAVSSRSANDGNCRCLNIIADDRSRATGFAFFCANSLSFPTFPAEAPCSKTAWSWPTLPEKEKDSSWGEPQIQIAKQFIENFLDCMQACILIAFETPPFKESQCPLPDKSIQVPWQPDRSWSHLLSLTRTAAPSLYAKTIWFYIFQVWFWQYGIWMI